MEHKEVNMNKYSSELLERLRALCLMIVLCPIFGFTLLIDPLYWLFCGKHLIDIVQSYIENRFKSFKKLMED